MKVALAAVAGAVVGAFYARRRGSVETAPPQDDRAEELRRKLAEAREAGAEEDDFEAAGMGAETLVEEPPPAEPAPAAEEAPAPAVEPAPEPTAKPEPKPSPRSKPPARKSSAASEISAKPETPPADEFEAMRRRVHEEGRAAADEMRRSADPPEQT